MAEAYTWAATSAAGEEEESSRKKKKKKKKRDRSCSNNSFLSVEHTRSRPSKRLKTLDLSREEEMGIADKQNPETERVREHQTSRRRRNLSSKGTGEDRFTTTTVGLHQREESSFQDHLPECKEKKKKEDQTAAAAAAAATATTTAEEEEEEEKQQKCTGEEIWMQYSTEVWKSQRFRYGPVAPPHTKKRKAMDSSEELHHHHHQQQQQPQEKKTCIEQPQQKKICIQWDAQKEGDHQVLDSGDARMQQEAAVKRKWKRIPWSKSSNLNSTDDMGVAISEAWKRLREEEEEEDDDNNNADGENSIRTYSDNGCSLSIETREKETMAQGRSLEKKARLEKSNQGRKWRRLNPAAAAAAAGNKDAGLRQPHEERDSELLLLSESSGASCTYVHNRMWKRPRFENLISVQVKALRKQQQQQQQQQEAEQRSKKRSVSETPGLSRKKQRIHF